MNAIPRFVHALHRLALGTLHLERRFEPWFRRPLNAVAREPLTRLLEYLIRRRRAPETLGLAEERVPPDEEESIDEIIDLMRDQMRGRFSPCSYHRGGNTKTHGIVHATLTVHDDLPAGLRHGILATPRDYPAWVRFSGPGPDVPADIRDVGFGSMGVKLMGVPGEKILDDERFTQDLITVSVPVFVTRDARENVKLQYWSMRDLPLLHFLHPRDTHLLDFLVQALWNQTLHNPLGTRYWSQTPFLLGDGQAMTFSFVPRSTVDEKIAGLPFGRVPFDYLRENMARTLARKDVEFDLVVQLQTDPDRMRIEDVQTRWPESLSPWIPVATLRVPRQRFDTPAQFDFDRHMKMNPWHCLPAHRPLGNVNRTRLRLYRRLSEVRLRMNRIEHVEPTGAERFD